MRYFAKLIRGGSYFYDGTKFERGQEVGVTEELSKILSEKSDTILEVNGSKATRVVKPYFEIRSEEPTETEKVLEEVKNVDDELGPKKPGRPKKED